MPCEPAADCAPCQGCGQTPEPLLPLCNIALPDGVYTNATITVDQGCIIEVASGTPFLYQPDNCCATPGGGGGGGDGLDGPQGPPGPGATIAIGTVASTPPATPPTVVNVGTPTNAILNFTIPRGEDGVDGAGPSGLTDNTAGIDFVDGSLQAIPLTWPPVLQVSVTPSDVPTAVLTATKNPATGELVLNLSLSAFEAIINAAIAAVAADLTALDARVTTIEGTCC